MSTKLTQKGTAMVDSQSLTLAFGSASLSEALSNYLAVALNKQGYGSINPSTLGFLSSLECGVNYGSELARSLGVSRQMVAKTVKELSKVGYLEQLEADGKQKPIVFTQRGEDLMAEARQLLANLDKILGKKIGSDSLKKTVSNLNQIEEIVKQLNQ